jgi:two-component system phosphate regulon sensor histidine kinase PhoR
MRLGLRARLFALSLATIGIVVLLLARLPLPPIVVVALAVTASGLVAMVGARQTLLAVEALAKDAQRMARGEMVSRSTYADHELSPVGRSLDQLAARMSSTLQALKVERDLLGGVLTGMQEGVLLVNPAGRVALVNPALRDMLLLGPDAVGRASVEAVHNADLERLLTGAREAGSSTGEVELSGIKPRRLLVSATALSGEPGGLLAVFVDVTDLRRLESIRRDFVANVSHELRTPVTAIRSAAETIRGAAAHDPEAAVRFLDIIERNADRLYTLVEDLLELSRIESREFRLSLEPVDLAQFVPYLVSLFRERAEKKRIRLHCLIGTALPPVAADRRALEQVLSNLVDNAVKYCPAGAEVSVSACLEGRTVRIAVDDTGPGIDDKHLPRIFERFYRVDAGRSREVGGTGLGLSIVKHLVEALGSVVSVDSKVGKGSSFSFALETAGAQAVSTPPSSGTAAASSGPLLAKTA